MSRSRLRGRDLEAPFRGVRIRAGSIPSLSEATDPYVRQRQARIHRARTYAPGLHQGHFFSHQTAASIWGAPLPLEFTDDDRIAGYADLALHVSAAGATPFPRATGVTGHRTLASLTSIRQQDGLRVTSPAATWVSLGTLPLFDIVALGDHMCRAWREGRGRPTPGRRSLCTVDDLRAAIDAGRRRGAARLRTAVELIREDSWSPRETRVRCILIAAGVPEPELNVDLFDEHGRFLGCVDMAYRQERVVIEYLGMLHDARWAADVERIAALRAAGWTVIEVTSPLLHRPEELVRRVTAALRR
ncbi:DUF559 domain-containing protein [Microbacterium sp. 22215]|uniref:DUF559 domain-containing protein n=1 Tax=Microbacterium sp. 22215 TaxID=3453893 RepID=UPI003F83E784